MRWSGILAGGMLIAGLLATCRAPVQLDPCGNDADCPTYYRCETVRAYCIPIPAEPCEILHLSAGDLAAYEGGTLRGRVLHPDGSELASFETTVQQGGVDLQQDLRLEPDQSYRLRVLLDVDNDERCGPGDQSWAVTLNSRPCPVVVALNAPEPGTLDCADFVLLGDANGDGCVDQADLDLLLRDLGLDGDYPGDLDGDGDVDNSDMALLESQYCRGHAFCCSGQDAGWPAPQPITLTGDVNCDGGVTAADIEPIDLALSDPEAYAAQYNCPRVNADVNCDGLLDESDRSTLFDCAPTGSCDCD